MMMWPAGTMLSDCCHVIAICDEDDNEKLICNRCRKPCAATESISEYNKRINAPKVEHQRLRDAVVKAAKAYHGNRGYGARERILMATVEALLQFEKEHEL